MLLGGPGKVVEVDEAKFGKRKFHRGRRVNGVWIFGILERGSNNCVVMPVEDRTEETLLSEIVKYVAPGATIISDCWASYNGLKRLGYVHMKVNHSKFFKDPETGAHTNTVEGMWSIMRRSLPYGVSHSTFASHVVEFIYLRRYFSNHDRGKYFPIFMKHLADLGFMW